MDKIVEYELLPKEILFVDGVTRTGKSMLNMILPSLESISHTHFLEPLEQLLPMYTQGEMSKNALSAYLRLYLNEHTYNYFLSRKQNFRYEDLSSIHNANEPKEFYKNLNKPDGENIIEEIAQKRVIFHFQTHDLLTHMDKFLDLGISVKTIELFRHPVDTVHSWFKRGWGRRYDNEDPRSFTLLFSYNGKTIPHYAIGEEELYCQLNEMEKCVFLHNRLVKKSIEQYIQLNDKKNILIMRFEELAENPHGELDRVCHFLSVKKSLSTEKKLQEANLPRKLLNKDREKKLLEIKNLVNEEFYKDLIDLSHFYEESFYDLELSK